MAITGVHALLYSSEAERLRAVLRDVFGWRHVDVHDGWLIFALPPGELACHPAEAPEAGRAELYLMCTDVEATRRELEAKGVQFVAPVTSLGFGLLTRLLVPGYGELGLYQPRHASPLPAFS